MHCGMHCPFCNPTMHQIGYILLFTVNLIIANVAQCDFTHTLQHSAFFTGTCACIRNSKPIIYNDLESTANCRLPQSN